jgi:hypothetical protein
VASAARFPQVRETVVAVKDNARTKVFVSYSHKDRAWLDRLGVFLKPLEREGKLDIWDDQRTIPGMK